MSGDELIAEVRQYNRWRRGDETAEEMPDPRRIGFVLDTLCDLAERVSRERDGLRKRLNDDLSIPAPCSAWIRCDARLPEMGLLVWLYDELTKTPWFGSRDEPGADGWLWGNAHGAIWHDGSKWDGDVEQDDDYHPTHWRLLPSLPNDTLSREANH